MLFPASDLAIYRSQSTFLALFDVSSAFDMVSLISASQIIILVVCVAGLNLVLPIALRWGEFQNSLGCSGVWCPAGFCPLLHLLASHCRHSFLPCLLNIWKVVISMLMTSRPLFTTLLPHNSLLYFRLLPFNLISPLRCRLTASIDQP